MHSLRRRYIVVSTLGAGTFGQVVKCVVQDTGEEVAVKVIKNQQAFYCQARAPYTHFNTFFCCTYAGMPCYTHAS